MQRSSAVAQPNQTATGIRMWSFNNGKPVPKEYKHLMNAGIDDGGTVFAAGGFHPGGEHVAMLCAGQDGTAMVQTEGHSYFPVDWLQAEIEPAARADLLAMLDKIKRAVHEVAAEEQ